MGEAKSLTFMDVSLICTESLMHICRKNGAIASTTYPTIYVSSKSFDLDVE